MAKDAKAHGRDRLVEAALSLVVEKRGLEGVGVREITRRAGMSPGSFYRHFESLEALGGELMLQESEALRAALQEIGEDAANSSDLVAGLVEGFLRKAVENEPVFVFCGRERHGASAVLRETSRRIQEDIGRDLARGFAASHLSGLLDYPTIEGVCLEIMDYMNFLMLDYVVASKKERAEISRRAQNFITTLFAGAIALQREQRAVSSAP